MFFRNGDLSRPQPGNQGRIRCDHQWNELADILNSVGGVGAQKQAERWKRVIIMFMHLWCNNFDERIILK